MDDPNSNNSSISSDEDSSRKTNSWNIYLNEEKDLRKNKLFNQYIYKPNICPKCLITLLIYMKKRKKIY